MRRRDVLKRAGTATTITFGAFAGSAAASSSTDEGDYFVTTVDGERVVVAFEDVGEDDVSTTAYCEHYCQVMDCSDCADNCDEYCDGCICP